MAAKAKRRAEDEHDLPHDIWTEILVRLPVKSILRCRSVCKSWYSLVSCPNFVSHYSKRNLNENGNRLLVQAWSRITFSCSYHSHDKSFMESREHDDFPESFRGQSHEIIGSCNGLICLYKRGSIEDDDTIDILIWNPTIRRVVEVPSPTFCERTQHLCNLGFGFDSKTGDYKVLVCTSRYAEDSVFKDVADVFEVFDRRKGVWRAINPPIPSWNLERSCRQACYLDGIVHWTGYRHGHDKRCDRILLSFDMRDELFREIKLPDCVGLSNDDNNSMHYHSWMETRSVTFGGLIHLIAFKTWRNDYDDMFLRGDCSVWAMKEYGVTESWTKLFNIDLQSARLHHRTGLHKFFLWKDGEVLIMHGQYEKYMEFGYHQELYSYDIESRECKSVLSVGSQIMNMCLFGESLALM